MHYMNVNETFGEKDLEQRHKNAASNIDQFLEAVPDKAATVRPLTTYHENYPS